MGGALAGLVLLALTGITATLPGAPALWKNLQSHTRNAAEFAFTLFAFVFLGLLMTFWYAAIRPRFGAGPKTAAIAALFVWLLVIGQTLKGVATSEAVNLPSGPLMPILYLVIILASTEAGAWLYREPEARLT